MVSETLVSLVKITKVHKRVLASHENNKKYNKSNIFNLQCAHNTFCSAYYITGKELVRMK